MWWVSALVLIILGLLIYGLFHISTSQDTDPVVIVFSTSTESATASLGGMISENQDTKVQVYDHEYLISSSEIEITQDIQSLIASFGERKVMAYGPAISPLHNAFVSVARGYPKDTVQFFIYENYPEVEEYMKTHVASLERYIEDTKEISLTKIILPGEEKEVVYQISQ